MHLASQWRLLVDKDGCRDGNDLTIGLVMSSCRDDNAARVERQGQKLCCERAERQLNWYSRLISTWQHVRSSCGHANTPLKTDELPLGSNEAANVDD